MSANSPSVGAGSRSAKRADETVKVIGMRRRIAENMAASKRHIPHFTYVEEIDVTALEELRARRTPGLGREGEEQMLGADELVAARAALLAAVGEAATVDAAAVVANFEMMTRIADGTGAKFPADAADRLARIDDALGIAGFTSNH